MSGPQLSPIVLFYGAQQAVQDLSGFCDRAPAACATGRDAIRFAGERIGDGLALAYSLANERLNAPTDIDTVPPVRPAQAASPVPDAVGSVERTPRPVHVNTQAPRPRPYSPPVSERALAVPAADAPGAEETASIPAAAPRSGTPRTAAAGEPAQPFRMPALGSGGEDSRRSIPLGDLPPPHAPLPQPAPRA
ncbi:DUF5330 domain-containing protein [Aureimonas sp. AU12]|uniref:DUF5330 domain-containing protein n=1 Tax=Aureimonas sp. AU12 TaxID=1638161 RepID=UPI0012E3A1DA|nr:DUF5330 domain-containing protein [Aureimonas sp. AU12]